MKICLVYPRGMKMPDYFNTAINIRTDDSKPTLPPMGLLYIAANSKYDIDILDNRVEQLDFGDMYDRLKEYDVIGFGGTIFEIKEARTLSRRLMKQGKITIYGGPNATVNWNLYLGEFNIIVRGEAEVMFDKIINGESETIGMRYIGESWVNETPYMVDVNLVNWPARYKVDMNNYRREENTYLAGVENVDVVMSGRGCSFACDFCSSKIIWGQRCKMRKIDNVIDEIKYLIYTYGTKGIYFREDNFTLNKQRLLEFCEKAKPLNIKWLCESRVDTLDEETIKAMSNCGCRGIWFGMEHTDNETLKRINKNITVERGMETARLCRKYGIKTGASFILGFPFETKEEIIQNYKKSKCMGFDNAFHGRIWSIPKSEMHTDIIDDGLDYYTHEGIVLPGTLHMTADELNDLFNKLVVRKKRFIGTIAELLGRDICKWIKKTFPGIIERLTR